jgi:hypothetical protein
MVSVDHTAPPDVVDRLLWRDAQEILGRHARPGADGDCDWCGGAWPCQPRRLAEHAQAAARRPWRESLTARHDLHSLRGLPSMRGQIAETAGGSDHRGMTGARRRARAALARGRYY